ncbi:hypothetical protein M430DRAFT_68977 [Amorphotheca resinae ATCC 22711]|uniref:Mso1 N-terminal domain-containing protein n=1 Tax=Amorphotheca resinae ATCC 22711 TaxID=857342 RepID=A0A2T3ASQ9_AMORE|nr:hypothetical protein M430DRAFT_68977 [Amorphotheca resinae ATCC 22711]PSS10491.1 hypothetical protein M430DRAFT_68977 [Amorphotheca resinae ATCC 22711]
MASYFSSLLTTTTSRVATLRQNLLPNENDGDTPDDTHLCRVLRAYYTEKGRQFPAWLPPDPKAPPPAVVQPALYTPTVGASYGGLNQGSGSASLSSLWDTQPQQSSPGRLQPPSTTPSSARTPPASSATRPNPFLRHQTVHPAGAGGGGGGVEPQVQARPLPSQRAGSYQSVVGRGGGGEAAVGGFTSAKDKLRKLAQPKRDLPRMAEAVRQVQAHASGGLRGGGSSNSYEDRFAPPEGGYAGVRGGGGERPFVAATSPWAATESEFGGGGYGGRQGLPSGPAAGRGPNGPRGYR